jgi:NAD(P)-dependent dehydrogenase (short-subunit alcohol dehydrogenase family)
MNDVEGLRVLVTGAASGIGKATTEAFAAAGARVAGLDARSAPEARERLLLVADVTRRDSLDAAVETAAGRLGGVDVLVNNAGIGAVGTIEDNSEEEWQRVFDVNVFGIVRATRAALPHLRRSSRAAIVNVSSVAGIAGLPERACYSASKGAVYALTLAMAADLVPDGVRVNCVCPGTVDTPWVGRLLERAPDPEAERAALEARQPMKRLGRAEEIAAAIVFLARPSSSFVTAVALAVDGGIAGLRVAR